MSAKIKRDDLLSGGRLTKTKDGYEVTRTWMISAAGSGAKRFVNAIASAASIGAAHPYVTGANLVSHSCRCEDSSPDLVLVEGVYKGGGDQLAVTSGSATSAATTTVDIAATLRNVQTNRKFDQSQISVSYAGSTQYPCVSKMVPNVVVVYRQVEDGPPETNWVGMCNSASWTAPGTAIAGSAHAWLCTGIQSTHKNTENTYYTTYSFELNTGGAGWDAEIGWKNPSTGQYAACAVSSVQIYNAISFGTLKLGGIR